MLENGSLFLIGGETYNSKITIKEDGSVIFMGATFVEIKNNGNEEYVVEYVFDGSSSTITLKFTDNNNGTYVFNGVNTDTGKLKR